MYIPGTMTEKDPWWATLDNTLNEGIRPTINKNGEENLGNLHKNTAGEPLSTNIRSTRNPQRLGLPRNFHHAKRTN